MSMTEFCLDYPWKSLDYKTTPEQQTYINLFDLLVSEKPLSYKVSRIYTSKEESKNFAVIKFSFSLQMTPGTFSAEGIPFHYGLDDFDLSFDDQLGENLKQALLSEIEEKIGNIKKELVLKYQKL
jgi:hypothetical protein